MENWALSVILIPQLLCALFSTIHACSEKSTYQRLDFDASKDVVPNKALKGHVIASMVTSNVPECQQACIQNSDCLSTNYRLDGGYCELNNADDGLDGKSFEDSPGSLYYRLNLRNICKKEDEPFDVLKDQCPKPSCLSTKCPSHTSCREMCHPRFKRYICQCPPNNINNCEQLPRTCDDIRKSLGFVPSSDGVYYVFNSQDKLSKVYCDFTSEPGLVYTLIESFSLSNNGIFKKLGFYADAPFEENSVNWIKYRLSKERMELITKHSTHVRVTCNMNIKYSTHDYLRSKMSDFSLFKIYGWRCTRYEFISIMGKSCLNCTSGTWQASNEHLHANPGVNANCDLGPSSGFAFTQTFGLYIILSKAHQCSSESSSTTQYWLGTKYT